MFLIENLQLSSYMKYEYKYWKRSSVILSYKLTSLPSSNRLIFIDL